MIKGKKWNSRAKNLQTRSFIQLQKSLPTNDKIFNDEVMEHLCSTCWFWKQGMKWKGKKSLNKIIHTTSKVSTCEWWNDVMGHLCCTCWFYDCIQNRDRTRLSVWTRKARHMKLLHLVSDFWLEETVVLLRAHIVFVSHYFCNNFI